MPIKRPLLANNEIYHITMRGVDGKVIFPEESDSLRFMHDLYEFNDEDIVSWQFRRSKNNSTGTVPVEFGVKKLLKKRKLLVEIICFCLMPNHFHLLLRQLKDGGISKFMRKLGGYATYINNKYERQGHLFQGRFRAVHISTNDQLKNAFNYIHTNPVELVEPAWKNYRVKDSDRAISFLMKYKWSSFLDYIGVKNYPSVSNRNLFLEIFGSRKGCYNSVKDWILYKREVDQISTLLEQFP